MKQPCKNKSTSKKWVTPELIKIQGLDSCVEFLYIPGDEGNASGGSNDNRPPWER